MNAAMANAVAVMATTLGKVGGTKVTYARGALSCRPQATKARVLRSLDTDQTRIEAGEQDWLITAAELVLDEETVLPARGDTIDDDDGIYTVLGDNSRPAWEPHDQYGLMLRVHSKRTGSSDG